MGLAETLTIVFVVLKLTGVITWSWWLVFLPEIIAGAFYLLFLVVWLICFYMAYREQRKFDKKYAKMFPKGGI